MRKVFDVYINRKLNPVFDIPGKSHGNGPVMTWWVYLGPELVDGVLPPEDSEYLSPLTTGVNRRVWDIRLTQSNGTKTKWDELRFCNNTSVEMWCNGRCVFCFSTTGTATGLSYAMARVGYLIVQLEEHCYNFFEPEQENGRKICYHGMPATVRVMSDTWEIAIVPDYSNMTEKDWWAELKRRQSNYTVQDDQDREMEEEGFDEDQRTGWINWGSPLSDGNIYWFRK